MISVKLGLNCYQPRFPKLPDDRRGVFGYTTTDIFSQIYTDFFHFDFFNLETSDVLRLTKWSIGHTMSFFVYFRRPGMLPACAKASAGRRFYIYKMEA